MTMDPDTEMYWSKDSPTQVIIGVTNGRVRMARGRGKLYPDGARAEAERVLASEEPADEALVMERGEMTGGVTE